MPHLKKKKQPENPLIKELQATRMELETVSLKTVKAC